MRQAKPKPQNKPLYENTLAPCDGERREYRFSQRHELSVHRFTCPKKETCLRWYAGRLMMFSVEDKDKPEMTHTLSYRTDNYQATFVYPMCFYPHPEMAGSEIPLVDKAKTLPPKNKREDIF